MKKFRIIGFFIWVSLAFNSCEEGLDLLSGDPRDAFVGDWSVTENTSKKISPTYYEVNITKSASDSSLVLISNFYELGPNNSVNAVVSGGRLTVSNQTRDGFTFQGSGNITYNDKSINWSYTVDYNNGTPINNVTATYTKK